MTNSFRTALESIAADERVHTGSLYLLSRLDQESLEVFKNFWPAIPTERRRAVMQELMEISEVNFEVDFDPVFLLGLGDEDADVRAAAIKGLWEHEHATLIQPLIHLLKTDPAVIVREAAASALGRFIYLKELEEIDWNEATLAEEALLETIYQSTEEIDVRRRAIESIGYSGDSRVSKIIEAAYYDENIKMRVSAIFAMGRNADMRWIPQVVAELDSNQAELRFEAARACGELEAKAAVEKLIILISEDPDLEVQEMAIWALGRIGGDVARAALEACLESDSEALALAAEDSLDELNLFDDNLILYNFADDDIDEGLLDLLDDDIDGLTDLDISNSQHNLKDFLN
jgi:HEAT repeat protein